MIQGGVAAPLTLRADRLLCSRATGELEMKKMAEKQQAAAQAEMAMRREKNMAVAQGRDRGSSDDEEDEQAVLKARAHDDWKARYVAGAKAAVWWPSLSVGWTPQGMRSWLTQVSCFHRAG